MKKILLSLPQLSLFVVILALLKLFLYYNNFNVPIQYFIGLSELALQISEDLFILIPVIFFMYFIIGPPLSGKINEPLNIEIVKPVTNKLAKRPILKLLDKIILYIPIGFFICVFVGIPLYRLYNYNSYSYSDRIKCVSVLMVDAYFFILIKQYEKLEKLITPKLISQSFLIFIFLFMFMINITVEIDRVEEGKYKGTKIITTDSTYTSTDSTFFVGQTSTYVFFYNRVDKHTTIIPTTEVKKIDLYLK